MNPEATAAFRPWQEGARAIFLALLVTLVWLSVYNRWDARNWKVPLATASDGLTVLVTEKSAAEGAIQPILPKFHPRFGAPYVANWNDYPITEEPLFFAGGWLSRLIGLFPASNFLVLWAHLLAVLAFYAVGRVLGYRWLWAGAGALVFALAHYAFYRGFAHLALTYYWHIPLGLLVAAWCWRAGGLALSGRRFWFALTVGVVTGVQNPYYTNAFLQFLGFAALAQLYRREWRAAAAPLLVGTVTVASFVLMNFDTLAYSVRHGKNPEAGGRNYQAVELYALKPLDLIIPPPHHRAVMAQEIAWDYVNDEGKKIYLRGELFSPYLGLVGIGALLWLGAAAVLRAARLPRQRIPIAAFGVLWLLLYAVVGGVNGLLGQLGLNLFRCANRYSIFILAIVLLFAAGELSRLTRRWRALSCAALAAVAVALALWDQLPPLVTQESIDQTRQAIASDRVFTEALENQLPPNAMVFQLPATKFPESWQVVAMEGYEHFRPYLFSRALHFSYADNKGRGRDDWQFQLNRLPVAEMIALLERTGFAALYVNRAGYADRGADLLAQIRAAGRDRVIESPAGDLFAVLLQPAAQPQWPARPPEFKTGWFEQEGADPADTWHYSKGDAEIVLHNETTAPRRVRLEFQLASPGPRTVAISRAGREIYRSPALTMERVPVSLAFELAPGRNVISFTTDPPQMFPGNPDTRLLGFLLYNFTVVDDSPAR